MRACTYVLGSHSQQKLLVKDQLRIAELLDGLWQDHLALSTIPWVMGRDHILIGVRAGRGNERAGNPVTQCVAVAFLNCLYAVNYIRSICGRSYALRVQHIQL